MLAAVLAVLVVLAVLASAKALHSERRLVPLDPALHLTAQLKTLQPCPQCI